MHNSVIYAAKIKKPQPLRAVVLENRSIVYYLPPSALAPETISNISLVIAA